MAKLVMAYWDCPVCGAKGVRGDVVNCPSCGRARGEVKFYMQNVEDGEIREAGETSDIEYLNEEQAASFSKNPDWYCSFCNSLNSDNAQFCGNCGASRADSEANYFQMLEKKKEQEAAEAAAQSAGAPAAKPRRSPLFILLALVLVIAAVVMWMNGSKTSDPLTVTSLEWVRNINVEENRMFSESGWELPAGAEQTDARTELHHYDNVLDHYETTRVRRTRQVIDHYETYYTYSDNGNGTYSQEEHQRPVYGTEEYYEDVQQPVFRQVPRYATKYYYNIWRWVPSRDVTASGNDHNTQWPEVSLAENEREGQRTEVYRFTVQNPNKPEDVSTWRLSESDWRNLEQGGQVYITSKRSGAQPALSDESGNPIADIIKER